MPGDQRKSLHVNVMKYCYDAFAKLQNRIMSRMRVRSPKHLQE